MKTDDNKIWNIILIASIILIIHGISNSGDIDKKTAQAGQNEATIGGGGLIVSGIRKQMAAAVAPVAGFFGGGPVVWFMLIIGTLFLIPGMWRNLSGLWSQPTIPGWVWVGAFIVLIFIVLKKR